MNPRTCPICRKTALEGEQIICPKCKAESPFSLLAGYSPFRSLSEDLKKLPVYEATIEKQRKRLLASRIVAGLSIFAALAVIGYTVMQTNAGEKKVTDAPVKGRDRVKEKLRQEVASLKLGADSLRQRIGSLESRAAGLGERGSAVNLPGIAAPGGSVEGRVTAGEEPVQEHGAKTHILRRGESLYLISKKYYGNGNRYPELMEANGISVPEKIRPGRIIQIPGPK